MTLFDHIKKESSLIKHEWGKCIVCGNILANSISEKSENNMTSSHVEGNNVEVSFHSIN